MQPGRLQRFDATRPITSSSLLQMSTIKITIHNAWSKWAASPNYLQFVTHGASDIGIPGRYIYKEQHLPSTILITAYDGTQKHQRLAEVYLMIPFFCDWCEVIALNDPHSSILIGNTRRHHGAATSIPSLYFIFLDYLGSNLYVCSVLYVCVCVVSLRIKGYASLRLKNQYVMFVHSSPTIEWTCSY